MEFALSEIPAFGIGQISSIFMYPMTFAEFLIAIDETGLHDVLQHGTFSNPVEPVFHEKAFDKLRTYLVIGGMPAVVELYRTERNLQECMLLLEELLTSIQDDFSKYKKKTPVSVLQETFNSIAYQTGNKFKYANVSKDESFYNIKKSLHLFLKAGLAFKVLHTSATGNPLEAQTNQKKFKIILFDCGIFNRILGLELSEHLIKSNIDLINKGKIAELFVGLEFADGTSSRLKPQLFYWHREAKNSNAKLDYVIQKNEIIYPVEVKSGSKGSMQSMNIFLSERKSNVGLRISQENFSRYNKIHTIPLYAASHIIDTEKSIFER